MTDHPDRKSNWTEACETMCDADGRIQYFQRGRWWCAKCRVMWSGSWAVSGRQEQLIIEMRHSCGTMMKPTSGDERGDPRKKESE